MTHPQKGDVDAEQVKVDRLLRVFISGVGELTVSDIWPCIQNSNMAVVLDSSSFLKLKLYVIELLDGKVYSTFNAHRPNECQDM